MKKTFTDEQIVGILRGFEPAEKPSKNTAGRRMSAKAHSTNGAAASGRWKPRRSKNTGNCSRKTPD